MAPGNNERHPPHPGHTGTIPKTKARNNCNVPQEAVTPTRRDMATNMGSTSLDWVPVSEYNSRSNHNQSRKPSNNTSDHELTDLDNSVSFESGFGRFVPVRPQPRALPLNQNLATDAHDDGASSTGSGHSLHPYSHQMSNGLIPHSNHAAAAVMIVNPTTPNAVTGNITQPFNAPNQNRNNLTRNLNPARNFDGNSYSSNINNTTPLISNSRSGTKTVNLINNMYDQGQGQGSFNNTNENHVHRESARALGEAIVAACPDAASVERRLGQIREYIRVTSSLVDTMRNSEDEAYIEHTKEEYDELVQMVMKLKESEVKLQTMLTDEKGPDNIEVPAEELTSQIEKSVIEPEEGISENHLSQCNTVENVDLGNNNLKKVTNIENEQLNKSLQNIKLVEEAPTLQKPDLNEALSLDNHILLYEHQPASESSVGTVKTSEETENTRVEIKETESIPYTQERKEGESKNEMLLKNILSCVEKVAFIKEMKKKCIEKVASNEEIKSKFADSCNIDEQQDVVVRPVSVQSNGSTYSENELWQNEIKNKMEMSQMRLVALKQQQKRLLKYQEEAKQQLDEMHSRDSQSQEIHPSTSQDNFASIQSQSFYHHPNRMYAANQIGVATTLPHTVEQQTMINNIENEHPTHIQEERFAHGDAINVASSEEAAVGRDSDAEDDEGLLSERARVLQIKLRELQLKKQHMEDLVTEFQKLQMATRAASSHNTYSSSGDDSGVEENTVKFPGNKAAGIKNEDPFKLMEIKAIKTALQKTKDLMRSVENYESDHLSVTHDEPFQGASHSNIHDNKSEGGGSMGGWSNEGSVCRVRNTLPQRHKFTNEQHSQQQQQNHLLHQQQNVLLQQQQNHLQQQQQMLQQHHQQQLLQQHHQQQPQQHQQSLLPNSHETNIASLQELAQELRMETEKIIGERTRIKDLISNKEGNRKQKKVNEEVRAGPSGAPGPFERRQMQLRQLLADKQRELEALLNKEKVLCSEADTQQKTDSRAASVINQSYTSEQEEPDSRSEQILLDSQNGRESDNFRTGGDSALGTRSINTVPSHLGSTYGSDSDSASRNKSNQRNRVRRRQPLDRQVEDNNVPQHNNVSQNMRHESSNPRPESSNVNMVPPIFQNDSPAGIQFSHLPPPCWNSNKSNQDMRNQFTQNSHSQTMERLLGAPAPPQMSFPPSMPYNLMMPYGMLGGCSCGCSFWGSWCWQQVMMQQREIHQLRDHVNHLEERWRAENASHTLNNQVPPGNRANNYWDNFRSYSRQNLLSANSKTNADGHLAVGPAHNPHPLVERSHNTLNHTSSSTSPSITPKRNTNAASSSQNALTQPSQAQNEEISNRNTRRNVAYERSLSFSSAPDVLNVNQNTDEAAASHSRNIDENVTNVNINRQENSSIAFRNLNIANPIPEIIQAHSNNLNTPTNSKKKSSSKLPAKNSSNRRNFSLDYSQTSNINIVSTSETPNPNLASTSSEVHDKATSKLFDLLRENVYSEVTTLIGVNESHPDFLIQLFRELQLISSDPLRQRVLQSIRNVLSQYRSILESQGNENEHLESRPEVLSTIPNEMNSYQQVTGENELTTSTQIDHSIIHFLLLKSEQTFTPELLEELATQISMGNVGQSKLLAFLSKYRGMRVCDVSSDIIENLPLLISGNVDGDESAQVVSELSESAVLQDVAGSLNLFRSSDTQLHQLNSCPYDMWPGHMHMDMSSTDMNENDISPRSCQEDKVDLINCSEMLNGDLAEADQTCPVDVCDSVVNEHGHGEANVDSLPDVVDTEETTPTEGADSKSEVCYGPINTRGLSSQAPY